MCVFKCVIYNIYIDVYKLSVLITVFTIRVGASTLVIIRNLGLDLGYISSMKFMTHKELLVFTN